MKKIIHLHLSYVLKHSSSDQTSMVIDTKLFRFPEDTNFQYRVLA